MLSHEFLVEIFALCSLRFEILFFYDKVIDQSIEFLAIMEVDLAKAHEVNICNHADHNRQDCENKINCELCRVYFKIHRLARPS